MILVSAEVIFFLLVFSGIGLLFASKSEGRLDGLLRGFWVGLVLTIAFLQVYHLFAPVGTLSFVLLMIASLAGWVKNGREVWAWLVGLPRRRMLLGAALAGLALLMLSNQAIWGKPHFDHGLYHLQTVKWLQSYAIVPGLGNLHHRLAFNNSSLLYAAQLDSFIFTGTAVYTATTLVCFVVLLRCFSAMQRLLQNEQPLTFADLYHCLLLPFLLYFIAFSTFSGYAPDSMVAVLQMVIAGELVEWMALRTALKNELTRGRAAQLVLLCVLLITVKLSAAVFAGLVLLAVLLVSLRRGLGWKPVVGWAGLGAGLVLPWLLRTVILSGYLLFPSTILSFPVQWKMPEGLVASIAPTIHNWATYDQASDPNVGAADWFSSWWNVMPFEMKEGAVYLVVVLGLVIVARILARRRAWQWEWRAPTVLLGICMCAVLYWVFLAPDVRFLGMAFWLAWVAALMLVCQAVAALGWVKSPNLLAAVWIMVVLFWLTPVFNNNISVRSLVMPPSAELSSQQALENHPLAQKTTRSGLVVNLATNQVCWDAALPCAPANDFYSRLTQIDLAEMGRGFYIQQP